MAKFSDYCYLRAIQLYFFNNFSVFNMFFININFYKRDFSLIIKNFFHYILHGSRIKPWLHLTFWSTQLYQKYENQEIAREFLIHKVAFSSRTLNYFLKIRENKITPRYSSAGKYFFRSRFFLLKGDKGLLSVPFNESLFLFFFGLFTSHFASRY